MNINFFPTKGNLILAKNTLKLSRQGYELLDKKRNVLIREIMDLNERAKQIQDVINEIFEKAYASLQNANIENGISNVERFSHGVEFESTIKIKSRSVMGVEIPFVTYENSTSNMPSYGFANMTSSLDEAIYNFNKVKDLIVRLSMIENAAYRLALNIRKTQKRANALKNVTIPLYEQLTKNIQQVLEEHDRDEFTRLKVIKNKK
jgi:H(+)-transporting ATP synthase, vacuolar type, subunit D